MTWCIVVPDQERRAVLSTTFRLLGRRRTSGELARDFPDYVTAKHTAEDDEVP